MKSYIFFAVFFAASAIANQEIMVKIEAEIPRQFLSSPVFLSGNTKELGAWQANKIALARQGNLFSTTIKLNLSTASNTHTEYKINLGNWFSSETYADGTERPNRKLECAENCTIRIKVENFRLHAFHPAPVSATAGVFYHHEFYFKTLENYRSIAVYLPPQYFSEPQRQFPVLYALDGQNLFDRGTMEFYGDEWKIDETLDRLNAEGSIEPFIVVGIYNTQRRADEYLQCPEKRVRMGGKAAAYGEFITSRIKPFIDGTYRTLPDRLNTALMGSSFGGSFTVYSTVAFESTFSKFIAMSPALWWADHCDLKTLEKAVFVKPRKIWIDMGDREGESISCFSNGVAEVAEAYELYLKAGVPAENLVKYIDVNALHSEKYWGLRAEQAFRFIFPKQIDPLK